MRVNGWQMKAATWVVLLTLIGGGVSTLAKEVPHLAGETKKRLEVSLESANQWIQSLGSPAEVCDIYDQAVRDLYWLDKGSKSLVVIGRSGIEFCLQSAHRASTTSASDSFKAQAKTIAYNVAANSWPGWGDDGVVIADEEIKAGLAAAELNLKLALELKKPDDKVAGAYWLLSALQLALGLYPQSLASIDQGIFYSQKTADPLPIAFNEGFKSLVLLASGEMAAGKALYARATTQLQNLKSEDAQSYLGQLATAKRIFVK